MQTQSFSFQTRDGELITIDRRGVTSKNHGTVLSLRTARQLLNSLKSSERITALNRRHAEIVQQITDERRAAEATYTKAVETAKAAYNAVYWNEPVRRSSELEGIATELRTIASSRPAISDRGGHKLAANAGHPTNALVVGCQSIGSDLIPVVERALTALGA